MQIPAFLKREVDVLPPLEEGDLRHVIAANGIFVQRRSPLFTSCTRLTRNDLDLADHVESCRLHCPQLPRAHHRAMLSFFRRAHQLHGGEAALVLLYHLDRRVFRWFCPQQTVEVYWSWYRRCWVADDTIRFVNPFELPPGYVHCGDAHLHPGSPHPSAIDINDDQDGLHIIVGNIANSPSYHVDFVVDGTRFRIPPESFFQDPNCQPFSYTPLRWLRQIQLVRRGTGSNSAPNNGNHYNIASNPRTNVRFDRGGYDA